MTIPKKIETTGMGAMLARRAVQVKSAEAPRPPRLRVKRKSPAVSGGASSFNRHPGLDPGSTCLPSHEKEGGCRIIPDLIRDRHDGSGSVVVAGQEGRREFGRGAVVVAAFAARAAVVAAFAAGAAGAALAARSTVAAAFAARAAVTVAAAVAPRAAIPAAAVTAIAPAFAVATRAAVAARAPVLPRRTGVLELGAGFLVDDAHRQADLAARVDLEDLDLHFLAFGDDVGGALDPLVLHLGDVDEAVLAAHEVHERAEIDDVDHLAGVDLADLGLLDDAGDPAAGRFDLAEVRRADLDHALVVDVDLGAGGGDDLADHLAAGADDVANLRLVDLHRLDPRRVGRELLAGVVERLGHLGEDVGAAGTGLV